MTKTVFFATVFSVSLSAQEGRVGVNTTAPATTLDINGVKAAGTGLTPATEPTGVQAPRLTRAELTVKGNTLYTNAQNGAIVYITDISAGDALSQRINITTTGYYYFDGAANVWQKMAPEPWNISATNRPATLNTQNIYQRGFVGSFPDLVSPTTPFPSFNFDATQNVTGIANGLRLANNATAVAGNGMQINLDPVNQSTGNTAFIRSIYNGTGGTNKSSALLIGEENANRTHLTLELGPDNSFRGNLGIDVAQDVTDKRPTQKLDVNGNGRIRALPDANFNTHPYFVVAKEDGTLGREFDISGTVKFVTGAFETLDLTNTTRSALKDTYFFSHGANITLPKATNLLAGIELTFYISGGAVDSFTTGLAQNFIVNMPSSDTTSNMILSNSGSTAPYSSLITEWSGTKIKFVNNINRVFRALKFKLVSNGQGTYRWVFSASGV